MNGHTRMDLVKSLNDSINSVGGKMSQQRNIGRSNEKTDVIMRKYGKNE